MTSLGFWTTIIVLNQTIFSIIISWLILSCRLSPNEYELHEVTLLKLLYIHDPEACGRVYFYNYTKAYPVLTSTIVWPVENDIAAGFRKKVQAWLAMHILWAFLGVVYVTQGQRSCGFYSALMPFTLTGLALLVMDIVYTVTFLMDARKTSTEAKILNYINSSGKAIRAVDNTLHRLGPSMSVTPESDLDVDTSWISLLMAYISCRAVVMCLINFWVVKDNYYEGLAYYRHIASRPDSQMRHKSSLFNRV